MFREKSILSRRINEAKLLFFGMFRRRHEKKRPFYAIQRGEESFWSIEISLNNFNAGERDSMDSA